MQTKVYKNYNWIGEGDLDELAGYGLRPEDTVVLDFIGPKLLEVRWKVFRFVESRCQPYLELHVTDGADFRTMEKIK